MYEDYYERTSRYWGKDGKILDFIQIMSMLFWVFMKLLNLNLHLGFNFSQGFDESLDLKTSHENWQNLGMFHDLEVKFLALACLVIFVSIFKELMLFPTLGPQLRTTMRTFFSSEVLFFIFLLLYLLVVFSISGWIALGARDSGFSTINAAIISFYDGMMGENMQESFRAGSNNRLLGMVRNYIHISNIMRIFLLLP